MLLMATYAVLLGPSHAPYYCETNETAEANAKGHQTQPKSFWIKTTCDPVALFTFGIFLFTAVLAISTIGLWRSTHNLWTAGGDQIKIAKQSANAAEVSASTAASALAIQKEQLRASVHVTDAMVVRRRGDLIQAIISIKNSGQTPAKSISCFYDHLFLFSADEAEVGFGGGDTHSFLGIDDIAQGQTRIVRGATKTFRGHDVERLASGEAALYFWGKVTFEDAFGDQWELGFRRYANSVPEIATDAAAYTLPTENFSHLIVCRQGNHLKKLNT
jgi:hypothetical protein